MHKKLIIAVMITFCLGWLAHGLIGAWTPQQPQLVNVAAQDQSFSSLAAPERSSPADRIQEDQIHVTNSKVVIDLKDAEWATFTDTNSMDPLIDAGANAIELIPQSPDDLQVGDIISYIYGNVTLIHRIIRIGNDSAWFARVKGDNIDSEDPGKVRFDQVERVVVGILY